LLLNFANKFLPGDLDPEDRATGKIVLKFRFILGVVIFMPGIFYKTMPAMQAKKR
jgi:hypothetical protein